MKEIPRNVSLVLTLLFAAAPSAFAQSSEIDELKATMKAMQQVIADQNARIAALEKQQHHPKAQATPATKNEVASHQPATVAASTSTTTQPAESQRSVSIAEVSVPTANIPANAVPNERAAIRDADTFLDQQNAAPRANNAPLDPSLKGFIPIPGTDTIFKIGGSARLDGILDFANNGNPNQFVPSTIPVPGQAGENGGERTTLHAKGTRLSLELRRPVPYDGTLRIFTEYDFFDNSTSSSMSFRVRHFYGQAWNFLIGQTFSGFMDIDVFPDVVDYQGPNGIVNRRVPQVRYTQPIYDRGSKVQLYISAEQPDARINTGTSEFVASSSTVNHLPDTVLGARWEGSLGHLQTSTVFRELSFESDDGPDDNVFGWGVSLSGALNLFEKDKLALQVTYGEGASRYINDLSGELLDAALENGKFCAIPAFATMIGYTHHWNEHWRSTVSGGYVQADPPDSLGAFAIDHTYYASVNLMWHPTTSFRMGLEYLYGAKETMNGAERDAHRLDFVVRYDLVR
jgi:hypothetical protein